jgi:hypothetical protein
MESGCAGVYWSNGQKKFSVRVLKRSSTQFDTRRSAQDERLLSNPQLLSQFLCPIGGGLR